MTSSVTQISNRRAKGISCFMPTNEIRRKCLLHKTYLLHILVHKTGVELDLAYPGSGSLVQERKRMLQRSMRAIGHISNIKMAWVQYQHEASELADKASHSLAVEDWLNSFGFYSQLTTMCKLFSNRIELVPQLHMQHDISDKLLSSDF